MASVVICDRCGGLGRSEALGAIAFQPRLTPEEAPRRHPHDPPPKTSTVYETCPPCLASFQEWMAAGKGTGGERPAFTEPYSPPESGSGSSDEEKQPKRTMIGS